MNNLKSIRILFKLMYWEMRDRISNVRWANTLLFSVVIPKRIYQSLDFKVTVFNVYYFGNEKTSENGKFLTIGLEINHSEILVLCFFQFTEYFGEFPHKQKERYHQHNFQLIPSLGINRSQKIINRSALKIDPCRTPNKILKRLLKVQCTLVFCFR